MTRTRKLRLSALLAAMLLPLGGMAAAQTVAIDQLGATGGMNIEGEVSDVFGNRFVLDDGTGRVLVETGPERGQQYDIRQGERLTVYGEPHGDSFDAFRIVREDGSEIVVRSPDGPPPWAGAGGPAGERPATPAAGDEGRASEFLAGHGFTDIRFEERKGRHLEFDAVDADGREVEIDVFLDGQVKKIEIESDGPGANSDLIALLPDVVRTAVAERGIVDLREFDTKGRHYEVDGYDSEGREIEMDIGLDGRIRKVEIDDDDEGPRRAGVSEEQLRNTVEENGYAFEGPIERKPRHFEVGATNPEGEPVELHVDLGGEIYKEQLRR